MNVLIQQCSNPDMRLLTTWWEVRTPSEDCLFWDSTLDKCKAFCEAHNFAYTIRAI